MAVPDTDECGREIQQVSIEPTDEGFIPAVIAVQRDLPIYWNIGNRMTDAEAGTEWLAFHDSTRFLIGHGENLWNFYPSESFDGSTGDHRFSCYVKVVDDLSAVDEAAIRKEVSGDEPFMYPPETFESSGMSCCG